MEPFPLEHEWHHSSDRRQWNRFPMSEYGTIPSTGLVEVYHSKTIVYLFSESIELNAKTILFKSNTLPEPKTIVYFQSDGFRKQKISTPVEHL